MTYADQIIDSAPHNYLVPKIRRGEMTRFCLNVMHFRVWSVFTKVPPADQIMYQIESILKTGDSLHRPKPLTVKQHVWSEELFRSKRRRREQRFWELFHRLEPCEHCHDKKQFGGTKAATFIELRQLAKKLLGPRAHAYKPHKVLVPDKEDTQ